MRLVVKIPEILKMRMMIPCPCRSHVIHGGVSASHEWTREKKISQSNRRKISGKSYILTKWMDELGSLPPKIYVRAKIIVYRDFRNF